MPKGNTIRKKQVIAPAITAALVLMMAPAMLSTVYAQNAHLVGQNDCDVNSSGDLECFAKLAGLGDVEEVTAHLEADVRATFGCDNPGQGGDGIQIPPGQPTDTQRETGPEETVDVRNGQTTFRSLSIEAPSPSGDFECPGENWDIVLVEITYTNVELVTTGFGSFDIEGTFSETLIRV